MLLASYLKLVFYTMFPLGLCVKDRRVKLLSQHTYISIYILTYILYSKSMHVIFGEMFFVDCPSL